MTGPPGAVDRRLVPAVRRLAWGRSGLPSRRAGLVALAIGAIATVIGLLVVVFGPPSISATDYARLAECSGDQAPNDGSCYSLVSAQLLSVGTPDGYLYVHVADARGTHEEQILDASYATAFAGGGNVELKYWHDLIVAVQVPNTPTLAPTFRDPVRSIHWGAFGFDMLIGGAGWTLIAAFLLFWRTAARRRAAGVAS